MKEDYDALWALSPRDVLMQTRPDKTVTCPHCWTAQRSERTICYRCGARFVYLDETARERPAAG